MSLDISMVLASVCSGFSVPGRGGTGWGGWAAS